jgi:hypothetical protein
MRSNGNHEDDRFLSELTGDEAGESERDEARARQPSDPPPAQARPSRAPAKPRARARKSILPKSVVVTVESTDEEALAKPRTRARKSILPKSVVVTVEDEAAAKPHKAPAARAKAESVAPKSRRSRTSLVPPAPKSRRAGAAAKDEPTPPPSRVSHAPVSLDPRTTLRDHPDQMDAARSVRAAVASMRPPPAREDEISIPPTSSDPPHDVDEQFFAEGEEVHRAHLAEAKAASLRPRAQAKLVELADETDHPVPAVQVSPERRRKMANYVKGAVAVSAFLCLVAGIRVGVRAMSPAHETLAVAASHTAPVQAAAITAPAVAAAAAPVAAAPAVAAVAPVAAAVAAPAAAAPPAAATTPAPAAAAAVPAAAADPAAAAVAAADPDAPPAKSAKEEKEDARRLLEHGKRKDAIEAGLRSVALDPTDAEAWLILGSAQQDAGHWKEGRESYTQCVKQAKVGPVSECRMMLH